MRDNTETQIRCSSTVDGGANVHLIIRTNTLQMKVDTDEEFSKLLEMEMVRETRITKLARSTVVSLKAHTMAIEECHKKIHSLVSKTLLHIALHRKCMLRVLAL